MGRNTKRQLEATSAAGQLPQWVASSPPALHALSLTPEGNITLSDSGSIVLESISSILKLAKDTARVPEGMLVLGGDSQERPTSYTDISLGKLRCRRWLACARNKLWWMTPEWGTTSAQLPPETQFLLMEREDGDGYAIVLPLIDNDTFRGTLRPPRKDSSEPADGLTLRMESGDEAVLCNRWTHAVLMAAGPDPYSLVEAAVAEAARLSGGAKPLKGKRLPPSIDVFGWCSWDAYYSSVSASGLVDAVASLAAGGTPPGLVIIDDGWQQTDLDPEMKAPKDPAAALSALRGDAPGSEAAARARESYIEGESEAIAAVLREIPAGTATGMILQEVKAAEEATCDVDYAALARQHDAATAAAEARLSRALRAIESATESRLRSQRRNLVLRLTGTLVQYIVGLIVGAFQALIIIFYQWIVDPAADGTWPVQFFAFLASGPLRVPMLQFYADQTNFTRRLVGVRANSKFHAPDATPDAVHSGKSEDLGAVVSHLKSTMNVQYVYCWHGLSAYWCGVSPEASSMSQYRPRLVFPNPHASLREIEPSMLWNPAVLGGMGAVYDPKPLFNDMHSYLASCGITGVKVDCQSGAGLVGSVTGGGPAVAARYHSALEDSVAANFPQNDAINCMCHSTENIYRWRDTAIARASDDFYPTDTASHLPHIAACAFNGVFLSALALPDFDMFHSRHRAADIHAAARAVSGGPVYVSDAPGAHSFELLRQLVLPDGQILRCLMPGRPTRDCLFTDVMRDGNSLLKIWNVNATTGVVGVFHLQGSSWDRARRRFMFHDNSPPTLTALVKPSDVEAFSAIAAADASNVAANADAVVVVAEKQLVGAGANGANGTTTSVSGRSSPSEISHSDRYHNESSEVTSGIANGTGNGRDASGYESDVSSAADDSPYQSMNGGNGNGNGIANGLAAKRRSTAAMTRTGGGGDGDGQQFAAWVNSTSTLRRVGLHENIEISLDTLQASIVTFAPVLRAGNVVEFAPLGLKNMLNSGGAVLAIEVEAKSDAELDEVTVGGGVARPPGPSAVVVMNVKGRGTLLAMSSARPTRCAVEGRDTEFLWIEEEEKLEIDVPQVGSATNQKVEVVFD